MNATQYFRRHAKTAIFFCMFAMVFALVGVQPAFSAEANAQPSWIGYYGGTIPAASAPGIEMWLSLDSFNGKTTFTMVEKYLGAKGSTFRSSGTGTWDKNGSILTLISKKDKRRFFVGKGWIQLIGPKDKKGSAQSKYALRKLDAFAGAGIQLLVDPAQVKTVKRGAKTFITFPGLMNFEFKPEGGHKSLKANFEIDCAAKKYDMPKISYYKNDFATGKLISKTDKNRGSWMKISSDKYDEDVMSQALKAYYKK